MIWRNLRGEQGGVVMKRKEKGEKIRKKREERKKEKPKMVIYPTSDCSRCGNRKHKRFALDPLAECPYDGGRCRLPVKKPSY